MLGLSLQITQNSTLVGQHTRDPGIQEAETEGSGLQDPSQLHIEFEASLGYIIPCLKKKIK